MQKPPTFMQRKGKLDKNIKEEQVWRTTQDLRNQIRRGFREGGQLKKMIQRNTKKRVKRKCIDLTDRELLLVFNNVMRSEARLQWVEE